ncbi:initiation factor 2, partial [Lentithecium fluviatile CBS 122367]
MLRISVNHTSSAMRNARVLRAPSTRDICIFCTTRQLAAADAGPTSRSSQRRHLNSSRKTPQYASEGLVYKEARPPTRPNSQAQAMRQLLKASRAPPPPPPQSTHASQPDRTRDPFGARPMAQSRQPLPRREPLHRAGLEYSPGRTPEYHRNTPRRLQYSPSDQHSSSTPIRYNVNMDSRPPIGETPAFGAGHLRRRNDTQQERSQFPPAKPPPNRLDQAEIDRLLGNDSRASQRPYTRLTRDPNVRTRCMHCGRQDHGSLDCPDKPVLRQQQPPDRLQRGEILADAAEPLHRRAGSKLESVQSSPEETEETRRKAGESERRRSRFRAEEAAPSEVRNRYEEPRHRRRSDAYRGRGGHRAMRDEDEEDTYIDKAERKRQRKEAKRKMQEAKAAPTPVYLPEYISVANLASLLKIRVEDFVAKLEDLGFEEVQHDHILNAEHAGLIAQEYNFEPILQSEQDDGDLRPAPALSPEEYARLPARPPVVTIMGHVDHGKTTILDYMRSTSVAATEFGGITQHIGAFSVPLASGKKITFLDTPGHAAFETMRARGANVTDIVVLVVAADDSVMPQTVEAIKHAHAAKVPIIVAINKIDKQQADPDAVKLDLGRHGIEVEDFGGDVQAIPVSGKTGAGIPDLEEAISTLSEMLDHRADPKANVEGWVLEGSTKKSGKVATILVRSGTLRLGDILVAGTSWTRVRSLRNEAGVMVTEVGPGLPVEVDGWREQPIAGDEVLQASDEQHAQSVSEIRNEKLEREQMAKDMEAINESRRLEAERRVAEEAAATAAANGEDPVEAVQKESGPEVASFIVKGDVSGSVEAVIDSISALGNGEIVTRILRHGVGPPSEFDIQHAADAQGHIVNFNTIVPNNIAAMAAEKGVKILDDNIIYRVVEEVKALLEERLPPRIVQKVTGEAEVAMVFEIGLGGKKKMKVAGSKVRNGFVQKGTKARVLREDEVVFEGVISSLKNQKKDVDQMRKDTECGIAFEGWEDLQNGDKIQCYEEEKQKRTL